MGAVYSLISQVPPTVGWFRYWPMSRRVGGWVLAANRSGTENGEAYPGTIFVAGPNGALHAYRAHGDGYVTTVIGRVD